MKKIILLLVFLCGFSSVSFAKEYGKYDIKKILITKQTKDGRSYGVNLQYVDKIIVDLSQHARNYPPKFDNERDKEFAKKDVTTLSNMLEILAKKLNHQQSY